MIAASRSVAGVSLVVAAALHLAGFGLGQGEEDVQIRGGQPSTAALASTSFADMTAGTIQPEQPDENPNEVEPEESVETGTDPDVQDPVTEPEQTETADRPTETADRPEPDATQEPVEQVAVMERTELVTAQEVRPETPSAPQPEPVEITQVIPETAPAVTPAEVAVPEAQTAPATDTPLTLQPVAEAQTPVTETPATPPVAAQPTPAVQPTQPTTVAALPVEEPKVEERSTTPHQSRRPAARPEHIEARAKPEPTRNPPPKKQPTQKPKTEPARQQATNAGNAQQSAVKGGAKSNAKSTKSAGNANLSNYNGKVFRKIQRAKRGTANIKGAVLVSLTISGNGRLTGVRVARSSGSAKLDNFGVAQVRRAAPFPPPPTGKAETFSISIRGGG